MRTAVRNIGCEESVKRREGNGSNALCATSRRKFPGKCISYVKGDDRQTGRGLQTKISPVRLEVSGIPLLTRYLERHESFPTLVRTLLYVAYSWSCRVSRTGLISENNSEDGHAGFRILASFALISNARRMREQTLLSPQVRVLFGF